MKHCGSTHQSTHRITCWGCRADCAYLPKKIFSTFRLDGPASSAPLQPLVGFAGALRTLRASAYTPGASGASCGILARPEDMASADVVLDLAPVASAGSLSGVRPTDRPEPASPARSPAVTRIRTTAGWCRASSTLRRASSVPGRCWASGWLAGSGGRVARRVWGTGRTRPRWAGGTSSGGGAQTLAESTGYGGLGWCDGTFASDGPVWFWGINKL